MHDDFKAFSKTLFSRWSIRVAFAFVVLFVFIAIFADVISPYDPYAQNVLAKFQPPSMAHWLGTDNLGRDILSRIFFGARTSLYISVVSILIGGSIGVVLGLVAGYFGGLIDAAIMRVTEALLAIPQMVIALALMMALGQNTNNLMLAIGISTVPGYIRVMRGQVISVKNRDYVTAERVLGSRHGRIMFSTILPNAISPMIVAATTTLGGSIMAEASLSFIGLGIASPEAAWGSMVSDAYKYIARSPWFSIAPGIAIMLVVLAFNILGDGLRDALDPRIRNGK